MLPSDINQTRSAVDFFLLIQGLVLLQMTWGKKEKTNIGSLPPINSSSRSLSERSI
jgi:hypothetical protein